MKQLARTSCKHKRNRGYHTKLLVRAPATVIAEGYISCPIFTSQPTSINRFFIQVSFAITIIITPLLSNYLLFIFSLIQQPPPPTKDPLYINLIHSRLKSHCLGAHIPPPSIMQFPRFPRLRKTLSSIPSYTIHVFGTIQFLSSSIVLAILAFFIHYLALETYYIPWTFILVNLSPFSLLSPVFLPPPPPLPPAY